MMTKTRRVRRKVPRRSDNKQANTSRIKKEENSTKHNLCQDKPGKSKDG
jgi:hypothetical protein